MNDLKIFENEAFGAVRVVEQNGEPWFVASDVAKALGYEKPNNAINDHCKKVSKFSYPESRQLQPYNIIPESDVYRLVMRSNLPDAERFQDWVVEEVLPSIRKHGAYLTPAKLIKQATGYDIGQNRFFDWLRDGGYLHKGGSQRNMPTQRCMDAGWMEIKEGSRIGSSGECHITRTTKITGKGQIYFINLFRSMTERAA